MYTRNLLKSYLELRKIPYQHHTHSPAFTAQQLANTEHVPSKKVAKTVVVKADGLFVLAVLPASTRINLPALGESLHANRLRLATEPEFQDLFPDCDVGAMPPFGNLYSVPVWADETLTEDEEILFNAGTHEDSIQMKFDDFVRAVEPNICSFHNERRADNGG